MRIWTLHPRLLDSKGLVALWRECLGAQKALEGKTEGYKNHPQLFRFKDMYGLQRLNYYMQSIFVEATRRGYNFDSSKIAPLYLPLPKEIFVISVSIGQVLYEFNRLKEKVSMRRFAEADHSKLLAMYSKENIPVVDCFKVNYFDPNCEAWEKV